MNKDFTFDDGEETFGQNKWEMSTERIFPYSFFKLFSLGLGKIEKSQANSKMAFLEAQIEKKRKEREEKGLNDDVRPPPLCNWIS